MTNPSEYKRTAFANPGVWVSAPGDITVTFATLRKEDEPGSTADFTVVRVIGNLKFENAAGETSFTFSPNPARLQVRFSKADGDTARGRGRRLALAWWNKKTGTWMRVDEGSTVLEPGVPLEGGDRYFDIFQIDDPPISWGT